MIKEPHNTVVTMPVADRDYLSTPGAVRVEINSQWDGLTIRMHEVLPNGRDGAHQSALADISHLAELGKYASSEG